MDGSYIAELALQEAVKLAKELRAQLRVMHVVDEVSLNWPEGGDFEEFKETFQTSSHKILEKADAEMHKMGVTAETKRIEIETFGHRVADMITAEARRPHRHRHAWMARSEPPTPRECRRGRGAPRYQADAADPRKMIAVCR